MGKFDYIDFSFHENEALFELVNDKKIDFAIVTQQFDTFDTISSKVGVIKQIIVGSRTVDQKDFKVLLKTNDHETIEQWLNEQVWFTHDAGIPHVKLFWLHVFDKKRPAIIPNYIIPSEFEMLSTVANSTGVALTWNCNAKSFLDSANLQIVWDSKKMPETAVFLLSNKNDNLKEAFKKMETVLKEILE